MKILKYKINPLSSFASFPKADMIFGHFASFLFKSGDDRLKEYLNEEPKIIFSDFLPDGFLPKPTLSLNSFGIDDSQKKEFRKKEYISIQNLQSGNLSKCESISFFRKENIIRNHINRNTFSTDDSGVFVPYSTEELVFLYQPVLYIMYDEKYFDESFITQILKIIGRSGFGKKSSIGNGQFEIIIDNSFCGFKDMNSDYYMTISPTLLNNQDNIENCYYDTFNRFGKYHSSNQPFKKPLLMANSSAVVKLKNKKKYIGKAIKNGDKSFVQGYSIAIPFEFKGDK
jgi:CRISPR type III-A-associated RAMP protein Csm4